MATIDLTSPLSALCHAVFRRAVADYHAIDSVDASVSVPYNGDTLEAALYRKCWIDAVQWHLEDLIRDPGIDPVEALQLKRRIDRSNQERTDMVERIDDYLLDHFAGVPTDPEARVNTESPAWAVDRLSILALKIYHMREQTEREDATEEHRLQCMRKLAVLQEQWEDLSLSIDQLVEDIGAGRKRMKVYRQMKMYNDPSTNPVLYAARQTVKPKEEE